MVFVKGSFILLCLLSVIICYCALIVASDADDRMEEMDDVEI